MRLDVRIPEDDAKVRRARAFLNGELVKACVMADEEAGVVERYEVNDQGHVIAFNGELRIVRESGSVRIEIGS